MESLFQAKVLAHSRSTTTGSEILTFQLRYPRLIHAEFLTHRVFSRNSSSSRAVPIGKMIRQVEERPASPIYWGENKSGMQPGDEVEEKEGAALWWREAARSAADFAKRGEALGLHKQVVNRVIEPFVWMDTIVTSTEWANFYMLRLHPDAQQEIQHLARLMKEAHDASDPTPLHPREAHLPYILERERTAFDLATLCRLSAARCARVSYQNHDGTEPDAEKDRQLAQRLASSKHWSPFEHQAIESGTRSRLYAGNFHPGWIQHRKVVEQGHSLDETLYL